MCLGNCSQLFIQKPEQLCKKGKIKQIKIILKNNLCTSFDKIPVFDID